MSETSGADAEQQRIAELRQVIRARSRDAEAKRSRNLAMTLAVVALVVAALASASDRPPEQYGQLSAVLLEGILLLVAFVTLQVSAGRLVQGRSTLDREKRAEGHAEATDERGWHVGGWLPPFAPVLLFVGIVLSCRISFRTPRSGWQLSTNTNSHPVVALWVLAGITTALAVCVYLLTRMTRNLPRPLIDGPEGQESEARTLPAQAAAADRRVAPLRIETPGTSADVGPSSQQESLRAEAATKAPLVLAFSGGGLRSASFCFGGFNAVQGRPLLNNVDAVVAVSGGGYAASAIALTRSFAGNADGKPVPPVPLPPIDDVYSLTSPEMAYLRRNSRYIFQPPWRTLSGLWQLVGGALINLFLFVAGLLMVSWLLGWYWWAARLVKDSTSPTPQLETSNWGWWPWDASVALVIAPLLVIAGLLVHQMLRRNSEAKAPSSAVWARTLAAASRAFIVLAVAAVLLPLLVFGLSRLAYSNNPTRVAAKVIVSLGLTHKPACEEAIGDSADAAHASAKGSAATSHEKESASYGGCGKSGTLTYNPAQRPDPYDRSAAVGALGQAPDAGGTSQLVTILAIVVAALGSLRRGFTALGTALEGKFAAVRRWLLLRAPLAAVSVLALCLVMQRSFRYAIEGPAQSRLVPLVLILAAVIVQLMNPNLTSIHEFYRERLSSAFAVGRDNANQKIARNLPYSAPYRLSKLDPAPELVLCTTANINDQRVVPTRRFGVPLTFSSTQVRLESGGLVPTLGYQSTQLVETDRRGPELTVMGASAMSGAAVSPMMGRMGAKVAPFRLLLTLFNVRLGVWVMNPRWPLGEAPPPPWAPMATQPRFHQLFSEAFGSTTIDDRWIYLTDGGHLDNLGLVEAVRRLPDRVLAMSASNDAPGSWQDVGAAVSVLRADLGIDLQIIERDTQDTWMRLRGAKPPEQGGIIDVLVVKASLTKPDWPLLGKDGSDPAPDPPPGGATVSPWPPLDQRMPIDIRSFATRDGTFPRTSTGRQDFGDLEFESYRRLGQFLVDRALAQQTIPF